MRLNGGNGRLMKRGTSSLRSCFHRLERCKNNTCEESQAIDENNLENKAEGHFLVIIEYQ